MQIKKTLLLLSSTALQNTAELQKEGILGSISYNGRNVNMKGDPKKKNKQLGCR